MTPREFFPNMPDEVFEMWLAPFIKQIGWPFKKIGDNLAGTRWLLLLGGNIPLYVCNQCIWTRLDVEFTKIEFTIATRVIFEAIIEHCVYGLPTPTANLPNTRERFRTCADFVRLHNTIPKPIVVISRDEQIEVMDGNHRIAALLHVGLPEGYKLSLWIPRLESTSA